MLDLKGITKNYIVGDNVVKALRGVDLTFRKNEFVAILGPSGCGKTTLLNIVGGLDRYTTGDLVIDGRSTKKYNDHDWDTYRNHIIGFVFQTYNLIPHQTVLSNVELSLTLSGISKTERRERAIKALEKVGLHDQLDKLPNQLSGGQMQRVAIARAIVNNPMIVLADEPTGALDTETSIQVMEILKEIAEDHLIIMVTHNPELADRYATRVVRALDGQIVSDSNPLTSEELLEVKKEREQVEIAPKVSKKKRVGMSIWTAFTLSFKNLLTKKGRTILTSFAGSIGIIGIALILSLSSGFRNYISNIEEETLASYPLSIEKVSADLTSLMSVYDDVHSMEGRDEDKVYANNVFSNMVSSMSGAFSENDLASFKKHLEDNPELLEGKVTDVQYTYDCNINIYKSNYAEKLQLLNPYSFTDSLSEITKIYFSSLDTVIDNLDVWQQMLDNEEFLSEQYDVAYGHWPENDNEVVLIVDQYNGIADYLLYAIGLRDAAEIDAILYSSFGGPAYEIEQSVYTYEEIVGLTYRVMADSDYYEKLADGTYVSHKNLKDDATKEANEAFIKNALETKGFDLKVVGIVKPNQRTSSNALMGAIGYTSGLANRMIDYINNSDLINDQKASPTKNIVTGAPIAPGGLDRVLVSLGQVDLENPSSINIYPSSFAAKDDIIDLIDAYNEGKEDKEQIKYSDFVGMLMSSISTIINAISYVLMAFVSISLIVSSIMIGIITHISVLERTKEIGILRSIGASKSDIARVFNCETFIVGLAAGVIGIGFTLLLNIPINLIIDSLTGIGWVAKLPWAGGLILIAISTILTLIAGLIPASSAAKKDPVTALRSD